MKHSFRLLQELLQLDVSATIRAVRVRWPAAGAEHATTTADANTTTSTWKGATDANVPATN
jgi:hypothetical protein